MKTTIRYEVLNGLPPYGEMYLPISPDGGSFYSEGLPVRFSTIGGANWVGNFRPGLGSLNMVHQFGSSKSVLVVSGGQCYLIDPDSSKLLLVFGAAYDEALKTGDGRLVLQDLTSLTIVENDGSYWHSDRIAVDGIQKLTLHGAIVRGFAFLGGTADDEWKNFEYNIDTKHLTYH